MSEERIWGSAPLVRMGERCPACAQQQFADHPVRLITSDEVDEDFLEIVFEMVWEDDRDNVDWDRLWESIDGSKDDDPQDGTNPRCWLLPDQLDDPVFSKIQRGIRKMRREG